ncbi:fimbrial protein [Enterobacter hormaechei]|uniref:fimbrial protein n=1 Tax=Enterobacter hormaechei TaxID=158836 RepID=UPI001F080262|nr:fimbrial protein [Enterobacter hormaechei]
MSQFFSLKRFFAAVVLVMSGACFQPAWAICTISGDHGSHVVTFPMPPTIYLEPDTPVGTIIYDHSAESGEVSVDCGGSDVYYRKGYLAITDADAREDVLPGVYKTNIPGIGFRAAASTERFPAYLEEDLVRPWHLVGMIHGYSHATTVFRAVAQLVVIGDVQEGMLDTSRLMSRETLDDAVVGKMRFSPTSVRITTNTCNLEDKNIYVPLRTVHAGDFDGQYSDILTDDSFKIEITRCAAGTKVDYKFTSTGSTGVTNGNILDIASGEGAARGVGIQILDKNNAVLNFDQDYTAVSSVSANEAVTIPLQARYIKTGQISAGKVEAMATFEVFYR